MALAPIWIGAHRSLTQRSAESLSQKDACMFPVMGSAVLVVLYFVVQYVPAFYLNLAIALYFTMLATVSLSRTLRPYLVALLPPTFSTDKRYRYCFAFHLWWKEPIMELSFDIVDLFGALAGLAVGTWWALTKYWIANNIMGLSFAVEAISLLQLGSFGVGCILLGALFVYDIYWVFGTSVMVTVATKFNAPIKLLFPKTGLLSVSPQFALLGLGDIVIPGIFIAMMLRFDCKLSLRPGRREFDRTYFLATYFAYICGLSCTFAVMHVFHAAQPALLYLVPACLSAPLLAAFLRGQLKKLVLFEEPKKGSACVTGK
eukprot:TRINITY_DN17001_c0_g1_i1.p1 TRINITY_DN17001_c0_g1~~TRINITY_DN17001_c0_g1_i1.p1  ORF type:complete len:350 (-),score=91.74 TRINITY_DN17001_c0_g1_i1:23-970(-)